MTEEVNQQAEAAEAAATDAPAADAAAVNVDSTGADKGNEQAQPTADVDPQDPLVVAEDENALKKTTDQANEEELALIAEEQRKAALAGDGNADAGGDPAPAAIAPIVPDVGVSNKVWVRNSKDGPFATCGLITAYDNETGVANITIFPDGEAPRPLASVPYFENMPEATFAWMQH